MSNEQLDSLRDELDKVNLAILEKINERARLVKEIGDIKREQGINRFDPVRERSMLDHIAKHNEGPFETATLQHLFKQIFKASLELQEEDNSKALLVSRKKQPENTTVDVKGEKIGDGQQRFVFGPCAVESYEQVLAVAKEMKKRGVVAALGVGNATGMTVAGALLLGTLRRARGAASVAGIPRALAAGLAGGAAGGAAGYAVAALLGTAGTGPAAELRNVGTGLLAALVAAGVFLVLALVIDGRDLRAVLSRRVTRHG